MNPINLPPNSRIVAFTKMTPTSVELLGNGVYEGDFPIPFHLLGVSEAEYRKTASDMLGGADPGPLLTPRLKLDNGTTVWGYQCQYLPEEDTEELFIGKQIFPVSL
jgi:hypothetical protein